MIEQLAIPEQKCFKVHVVFDFPGIVLFSPYSLQEDLDDVTDCVLADVDPAIFTVVLPLNAGLIFPDQVTAVCAS